MLYLGDKPGAALKGINLRPNSQCTCSEESCLFLRRCLLVSHAQRKIERESMQSIELESFVGEFSDSACV